MILIPWSWLYEEFSYPFVVMLWSFNMFSSTIPVFIHSGSLNSKLNSVPEVQVTSLLPLLRAPDLKQLTSTTVPGTTGNCVVVLIAFIHSAFSPVQLTVDMSY